MTYADEINEIACRWAELGVEVPDTVHVSSDVYDEMVKEMKVYSFSKEPPKEIKFISIMGEHRVVVDRNLPPNFIHMNRMTYNDFIVEDILLDDADFDFFDD